MNLLVQADIATNLTKNKGPFLAGRNAVATNFTAGALILQGSIDGVTYTTLATVPASGMIAIPVLPNFIKVSTAATVYLLAAS